MARRYISALPQSKLNVSSSASSVTVNDSQSVAVDGQVFGAPGQAANAIKVLLRSSEEDGYKTLMAHFAA